MAGKRGSLPGLHGLYSRVHMANVGMRWSWEVEQNAKFLEEFTPSYDIADTPRLTQYIYETDDARHGK